MVTFVLRNVKYVLGLAQINESHVASNFEELVIVIQQKICKV